MTATSVVLKFGSSVLADRHCLPRVVHEIYRYCRRGHHVLAVVSAIGNETDRLLAEARYWSTPPAPELAVKARSFRKYSPHPEQRQKPVSGGNRGPAPASRKRILTFKLLV